MKKLFVLFLLCIAAFSIQAQSIDSVVINYSASNQILSVNVLGRIMVADPFAIVNISDSIQNDTVTIDIDFWPCSPFQLQVPYDTLVEVNLAGIAAGPKTLRVRSFEIADIDTTCYYRATAKLIVTKFVPFSIPIGHSEESISQIKIYPNPTNGVFFVDLKIAEKTEYSVYNATGQIMLRDVLPENGKINMEQFQAGVYFLKVLVEGNLVTQKILKL